MKRTSSRLLTSLVACFCLIFGVSHAAESVDLPVPGAPPLLESELTSQTEEPFADPQTRCYQTALRHGNEIEACGRALAEASVFDERARAAAYTNRALIKSNSNNLAAALIDIEHALKIFPNEPALLTNQGNLLWRLRRFEEASEKYQDAIDKSDGKSALAYYNRMFVHRVRGDIDLANRDFETARRLFDLEERQERATTIELPADLNKAVWRLQQ